MNKLEQINNHKKSSPAYIDISNIASFLSDGDQIDASSLDDLCNQYCDSLWGFLHNGLENSAVPKTKNVARVQLENFMRFKKVVLRAVSNLPLRNREVIELVCFHGYSVEEAAMIVDCSVSVAEIRLSHARHKINAAFQNEYQ